MKMSPFAAVAVLALVTSSAYAACNNDDIGTVGAGITWCKLQCDVPNSQGPCSGSGKMAASAASGDANGVREGFEQCQEGNDQAKGQMQACFRERPDDLLDLARGIYGYPPLKPPPTPVPTPQPTPALVVRPFDVPMIKATNKQIVVASFHLDVKGAFASITMDFYRDSKKLFTLDTYSLVVVDEGDGIRVKITSWDTGVKDVDKHKYHVTGEISFLTPAR